MGSRRDAEGAEIAGLIFTRRREGREGGKGDAKGGRSQAMRLGGEQACCGEVSVEAPRRKLKAIGPSERSAFDEGAGEISGVGERLGQYCIAGKDGFGRPAASAAIRKRQHQTGWPGDFNFDDLNHLHLLSDKGSTKCRKYNTERMIEKLKANTSAFSLILD